MPKLTSEEVNDGNCHFGTGTLVTIDDDYYWGSSVGGVVVFTDCVASRKVENYEVTVALIPLE